MSVNRRHILVMGVCGVGKSTVARMLSERLGGSLVEADDYHPEENIRAMSLGVPLTDANRWAWLETVCRIAAANEGDPVVIACSALKRRYRDLMLERLGDLRIVHLTGDPALIRQRMDHREGHFMPVSLLDSQLADLETPESPEENVLAVDIADAPDVILDRAERFCRAPDPGAGTKTPDGR